MSSFEINGFSYSSLYLPDICYLISGTRNPEPCTLHFFPFPSSQTHVFLEPRLQYLHHLLQVMIFNTKIRFSILNFL